MRFSATKFADASGRSIDASTRGLSRAVYRILTRIGEREAQLAIRRLKKQGERAFLRKSAWDEDTLALADLLERYGLRQFNEGGDRAATGVGGAWVLKPKIKDEYLAKLERKVQLVIGETRDQIHASLRDIIREGVDEVPRPSTSEIARRIARQYHGPAESRESLFSFERATLIARTEIVQAENSGIFQGYKQSGVERIEWLAFTDGKSGKRHHERMNGKSVKLGEYFTTPLGSKMRFPGDPSAPIGETANCRCSPVPA